MEYRETFKVKGKFGTHAGPAEKIAWTTLQYQSHLEDEGYELEIEITKKSCPEGINIGEKADASQVIDIISLLGLEGSELEVAAILTPDDSTKENELKKAVNDIGTIIKNVDKYTIRPH